MGLKTFAEGVPLTVRAKHKNGEIDEIPVAHTYNSAQIEWFKAGAALNIIRQQVGS